MKAKLVLHLCFLLGWLIAVPFSFHPVPGSSQTKQFTQEWRISLDSLRDRIHHYGGMRELMPGFFMETEFSQCIVVTDTYLGSSGRTPLALDRDFDRIRQDLDIQLGGELWLAAWEDHHGIRGTSDLESRTVQFRLAGDTYEGRSERESGRSDHRLLDGIAEDMDLRLLVPSRPVAVGDSWDLELDVLSDLLSPGGHMAWKLDLDGGALLLGDMLDPG